MTITSKDEILNKTKSLYAKHGFEEFSIRRLAKEVGVAHSVVYHYFADEETLLKAMFDYTNIQLGLKRGALAQDTSAKTMLKQRIAFQIDNSEDIVAVLKYYIAHRPQFKKNKNGFVPDKSALHIEEVLEHGKKTKEFTVTDLEDDAKVITHAINGFLLEYYPHIPTGIEKLN
jgi:AcrR family transcriptional regulator